MPTCANASLLALLKRWTAAAEDANHSTQQARTFRRAANGLTAHPTLITTREGAPHTCATCARNI